MSKQFTASPSEPKQEELWLPCNKCSLTSTSHKRLTTVKASDESECGEFWWQGEYSVVQCGGCKDLSFIRLSWHSEDYDQDGYEVTEDIYPPRRSGKKALDNLHLLPHVVQSIYSETFKSLANNQPILAGIGMRAIVEAVCSERQASGSNLYNKIDNLSTIGLLTPSGATILHKIRVLGNKAAHEIKANTQSELNAAFEVVEYLLKGVYIIPNIASEID